MKWTRLLCLPGVVAGLTAAEPPAGFEKVDETFTIRTLPSQMKYDVRKLTVRPGAKVRLALKNDDQLPHNLAVLTSKGIAMAVAQKAWELAENGPAKQWIPDDPRVLAASKLVDPGQSGDIWFKAPDTEGDLDFVCTFPGHAMIMNGVIHVTTAPKPGLTHLTYMLYHGSWDRLPDFATLPPAAKVRTEEINDNVITLGVAERRDHFALVYDAQLNVPAEGDYKFFLSSDDGSRLVIDDKPVITHDGIHPQSEKTAKVRLSKGPHRLQLQYFEQAGEEALALAWDGPGVSMQVLTKDKPSGERFEELVLEPKDGRPVIYRGFMGKNRGSRRLISVGYPGQLNAAFDQDQLRLGLLWKGGFLDVGRHWNGRGAGDIEPAGYAVLEMPKGEDIAVLSAPDQPWPATGEQNRATHSKFKGYTLDPAGLPTFRYTAAGVDVEDRLQPDGDPLKATDGFLRTVVLKAANAPEGLHFRALDELGAVTALPDGRYRTEKNLTVAVTGAQPVLHGQRLLVPVRFENGQARLTIRYTWF